MTKIHKLDRDMSGNYSEMEVFVCVVEHGNYSAAARSLGLTPSAISKVVTRLEDRLGAPLAMRSTRMFQMTEEGEVYFRRAREIVKQIHEMEQNIGRRNEKPQGVLRVSSSIPFAIHVVSPLVPEFLNLFPGIKLELDFDDRAIDLIFERCDIALRTGALADSSMIARRLVRSPRRVVASPAYLTQYGAPQSPRDLSSHNCLSLSGRKPFSRWPFLRDPNSGELIHVDVSGNLSVNNGENLRSFALAGVGLARLADFHTAGDFESGGLVEVLDCFNPGDLEPISAIYPAQSHVPARIRAFIDFLVARI